MNKMLEIRAEDLANLYKARLELQQREYREFKEGWLDRFIQYSPPGLFRLIIGKKHRTLEEGLHKFKELEEGRSNFVHDIGIITKISGLKPDPLLHYRIEVLERVDPDLTSPIGLEEYAKLLRDRDLLKSNHL